MEGFKFMKILSYIIGVIALLVTQFTSISACFWGLYEPELPEDKEGKEEWANID
jgi:cyclic lactone autoinducer peptide